MPTVKRLTTRTFLLWLFGLSFFYFYSGGGANQASRIDLDRAILENHQVTIDDYHRNTIDKAFFNNHYYCDKAPGASFFVLPILAVSRSLFQIAGVDTDTNRAARTQVQIATWTAGGLPAITLCLLVYGWCRRLGSSQEAAVVASIAVGLASPIWAYATVFWGSTLASFCVLYAASRVSHLCYPEPKDNTAMIALGAGLSAGGAVVTEFPTLPLAAFLFIWLLFQLRPWKFHRQSIALFAIGALAMALILISYNSIAFGNPFHLGYASVKGFNGMKQGVFGVTWPRLAAISGVVWGSHGLLTTAPILLFGLVGHLYSIVRRQNAKVSILCLFCSVYPFLLNVSYVYWDGGSTYGPRHMSTSFAFLAMGLAPLYDVTKSRLRPILLSGLAGSSLITLMAVSVNGMTPRKMQHPVLELYWPSFRHGEFAQSRCRFPDAGGRASNLGMAFGLKKQHSIYPFFAATAVILFGLVRSLRKPPEDATR